MPENCPHKYRSPPPPGLCGNPYGWWVGSHPDPFDISMFSLRQIGPEGNCFPCELSCGVAQLASGGSTPPPPQAYPSCAHRGIFTEPDVLAPRPPGGDPSVCLDWVHGRCSRDSCRFAHTADAGRISAARSPVSCVRGALYAAGGPYILRVG